MNMNRYLIAYDLDKPGQDYTLLIKRLNEHGATRLQYSLWALRTTWTAPQLRNDLKAYIDGNDMLLVAGLNGETAWTSLMISNEAFKELIAA